MEIVQFVGTTIDRSGVKGLGAIQIICDTLLEGGGGSKKCHMNFFLFLKYSESSTEEKSHH